MARRRNKLTAKQVHGLTKPALHSDGDGLYLQISKTGAKSWIMRYMIDGAIKTMGLGPYPTISLAAARERADCARRVRADGVDPLAQRRAEQCAAKVASAREKTFTDVADEYVAAHKAGWRSEKTLYIWRHSLCYYAGAAFGSAPIAEVSRERIVAMLEPIWTVKPETAGRVRRHVESVLAYAIARGYRSGDNPALWRGALQFALPALSKVQTVRHHPALPYKDAPSFMQALAKEEGAAARALQFAILTASRTGEVLGAAWSEINLSEQIWTIPGERMKTGALHRVPLSPPAIEILGEAAARRESDFVFPGQGRGKPLSNMAFLMLLRRMKRSDITAHGFRSTFRDWAGDATSYPRELIESALAHMIGNEVERAYRRGDGLEKRRLLMYDWGNFLNKNKKD